MCRIEEIIYVYSNGSRIIQPYHSLCEHSIDGRPCRTARRYHLGEQRVNNFTTSMDNQPLHSRPTQKSSAESSRAREDQLNASTGAGRRSSIADRAGGAFIRPAKKLFERHSSKGNKRKDPVLGGAQAPQVNQPNPPHGRLQPSHGAQIRSADTTEDLYDGGRGMVSLRFPWHRAGSQLGPKHRTQLSLLIT